VFLSGLGVGDIALNHVVTLVFLFLQPKQSSDESEPLAVSNSLWDSADRPVLSSSDSDAGSDADSDTDSSASESAMENLKADSTLALGDRKSGELSHQPQPHDADSPDESPSNGFQDDTGSIASGDEVDGSTARETSSSCGRLLGFCPHLFG
jgi:hypothetical protein